MTGVADRGADHQAKTAERLCTRVELGNLVDHGLRDRRAELGALVDLDVVAGVLVEQIDGVVALGPDVTVEFEVVARVAAGVVDRDRLQRDLDQLCG